MGEIGKKERLQCEAIQLEKEFALSIGWTNIRQIQGVLVGTPSADSGVTAVRGESIIPKWARDGYDSQTLQDEFGISTSLAKTSVIVFVDEAFHELQLAVDDFTSRLECLRFAILRLAILMRNFNKRKKYSK